MSEAPWSRLLIELARLAPDAVAGVEIDPEARALKLTLRQAISARPRVNVAADIAMSFGEAGRLGVALAGVAEMGRAPATLPQRVLDDAADWIERSPSSPAHLVGMVALIRSLMRLGSGVHVG